MLFTLFVFASMVIGGFPPPPRGITKLKSKYHENVTISYKEPGICETTPNVKSYSGYVHLPPGLLSDIDGEGQPYPINTFFWFFEARKDPQNAPLAIWLNGGPGGSSLMGLLQENGPCFVGADSNSTYLNSWSWNNEVNMLYLDQPVQTGFSYDVLTNITVNLASGEDETPAQPADFSNGVPETNITFLVGTAGSQLVNQTANTTVHAAHALWHFAQTWFSEFPAYKPHDDRVSIWAESYGGHYGPGIMKFFQEQNERIQNGTIKEKGTHYLHLDTLGIVNGLVDVMIQFPAYTEFAYRNTYGLQLVTKAQYEESMEEWYKPGGCKERLAKCQQQVRDADPDWKGNTPSVLKCFRDLESTCTTIDEYAAGLNTSYYDIAHPPEDPTPEPHMYGYLNHAWVLSALGVPVNFTSLSMTVNNNFQATADIERGDFVEAIAYLLDSGVKVHFMYGDRDYGGNWFGGESVSLAVEYSRSQLFRSAGYAPILGSEGVGGYVRQHGNFSFSRVLQAGHEVPWYQPEVAYNIFTRSLFNKDISTGSLDTNDDFATVGPDSVFHIKNIPPAAPEPKCYVLVPGTCTREQYAGVLNGTAIVKDFFVVAYADDVSEDAWKDL